jgi:proteic killer suppression protein
MLWTGGSVEVTFRTSQLEACFRSWRLGQRAWGTAVARRYVERLNIIRSARAMADLYAIGALRLHPLTGPRQGQLAMTLKWRWRLIVTVGSDTMTVVRVEEVSKPYDD